MTRLAVFPMLIAFLYGCASNGGETVRSDRLYEQIYAFNSDASKARFLADEAARAGVERFVLTNSSQNYGRARPSGVVELSSVMPGGLSATNITHEVAHVAAMNGNCGRSQAGNGHTKCWLTLYLNIAKRYEEAFPEDRWSGTTPTKRVMRNADRYDIWLLEPQQPLFGDIVHNTYLKSSSNANLGTGKRLGWQTSIHGHENGECLEGWMNADAATAAGIPQFIIEETNLASRAAHEAIRSCFRFVIG